MIDDRYDDSRADVARRGSSARGADRRDGADVIANILQAVLAVVVFVLVLHIVFVLGAANHHNAFVHGVHRVAKTLVLDLENGLATDYATLVGTTTAGTRTVLVDLLVDAAVTLDDWGAEPDPFPGLPEQAEDDPAS